MAISLKDKKAAVKPFSLELDGETITGTFRPGVVTFGWSRKLQNIGRPESPEVSTRKIGGEKASGSKPSDIIIQDAVPDTDKALIAKILEVVASWDVEYEPGEPVPLTEDGLMDVPTEILTQTLQGVIKAASGQGEAAAGPQPPISADFS